MRPVYGPVLSVVRAAAHAEALVSRAVASLPSAERGVALVGQQLEPVIVDRELESMRRVERRIAGEDC